MPQLTKAQVENVFNSFYVIEPPKHLVMLDRRTVGLHGQVVTFYKGLQPKWREDVIIITPDGNEETVIHETIHANFGTQELFTQVAGKVLSIKYRIISRIPRLGMLSRRRNVEYQLCGINCQFCSDLSGLKISTPPGARPRHFVRVK